MSNPFETNSNQQDSVKQNLSLFQDKYSQQQYKTKSYCDNFQGNQDNKYNKSVDTTQLSNMDSTPNKQYINKSPSLQETSNSSLKNSFLDQTGQNFNPQQQNQFQSKESREEHKNQQEYLKNECDLFKINNQLIYQPQKQQTNQIGSPKRIQESDLKPIKQLIQYYQQSTTQMLDKSQIISQANRFLSLVQQNENQYIDITNILCLKNQTQQDQINTLNNKLQEINKDQDIQNFLKQKEYQESMLILQNKIDNLNAEVNKLINQKNYLNEKLNQNQQQQQQQIDQNNEKITQLEKSLDQRIQQSLQNQKLYEKLIQDEKVKNENNTKEFQELKKILEQMIDSQQNQIDQLTTENYNLTNHVEQQESSQKNIQKIEQDLNMQIHQKIKLNIELQNKIIYKENEVQELQNNLQQQIDNQNKQIFEINQLNKELIKYQDLYKESEQNYQCAHKYVKYQDIEIEVLKQKNIKLQKDLENNGEKQSETVKKIFQELSCSQIKGNDIDTKVEQVLTQLNPQVQIQSNQIQFAKAFSIIEQNKPSVQEKANLQIKNNQIIEKYKQDSQSSQYQANTSIQNKNDSLDPIQCLLVLQNMYKDDGITTYITDQSIQALQKEENYQQQQSFIQIGLHDQASYFQMKFDKQAALYDELMQTKTKNNLNDFLYKFKSIIGQKINTQNPQQDVIIMNVAFVQVPQIDFRVVSNQYSNKELKKIITFRDIGVSVSEQSLLESAKLTPDMFNPQYNMEWGANYQGKSEARGQLKFYDQPNPVNHIYNFPVGYKGYALDVSKYGNDLSWISSKADSKTWIVLFHGTNQDGLSGIMQSNLEPGDRNNYGGHKCRITGTIIKSGPKSNVYLTDSIKVAERFAEQTTIFNQKKFKIIFQCRVNPGGVKSPIKQTTYYTVEQYTNIRPYRILLKEC
ncbi:hypothetical protein ABPG74_014440 [Tetrahymena malaccensis]